MPTYWFRSISSGAKVTASTLQEINRLAQREANKFGQGIQVHSESGRKSHRRMSAARNPINGRVYMNNNRYGFTRKIINESAGVYRWSITKGDKTIASNTEPTLDDAKRVVRSTTNFLKDRGY